jgi:hypothetical protein
LQCIVLGFCPIGVFKCGLEAGIIGIDLEGLGERCLHSPFSFVCFLSKTKIIWKNILTKAYIPGMRVDLNGIRGGGGKGRRSSRGGWPMDTMRMIVGMTGGPRWIDDGGRSTGSTMIMIDLFIFTWMPFG